MTLALLLMLGQVSLADEGGAKKVVNHLNCVGAGISCTSSSTFGTITVAGGGGGAPTTVPYWTGAADATLSAEHNLGALGTGLVINTAGTPSIYAGSACGADQYVTSTNASGAVTCSQPALRFITANVTYTDIATPGTVFNLEVLNLGIPAKARVVRLIVRVTEIFDDGAGPISAASIACGPTSATTTYLPVRTIRVVDTLGDVAGDLGTAMGNMPDYTTATDLWCQFTCGGGGNLDTLTTGALTIHVEYIQYP